MCVVSSAWQQAVPGLMEHLDTLPGLSSEWTESSDSHEDRLKQVSYLPHSMTYLAIGHLGACVCYH